MTTRPRDLLELLPFFLLLFALWAITGSFWEALLALVALLIVLDIITQ